LLPIDAPEVTAEEGGGSDEEGDAVFFDEFSEAFGVERGGVGDELDAFDDGIPKGHGAAEAVEEGKAAEDAVFGVEVEATAELGDVSDDVAVGEDDAFGIAGAATGEEEEGLTIAAFFCDAEEGGDERGGEDFGEEEPLGDLGFERRQDALNEDHVSAGGPGEGLHFADEDVSGDEAVDTRLFDGGNDGFVGGGEVEVDGSFASEEDGDVGDETAEAGGEDDGDAVFLGFGFDVPTEGDGGGEGFVEAEGFFIGGIFAIDDARAGAVFFEALDEGVGEAQVE
jgi:hypothetical protein